MPELPEAETIARELHRVLTGRTLADVRVARRDILRGDPRPIEELVQHREVLAVRRSAKRVIVELDSNRSLVFALGMTGRLTIQPCADPVESHTHLRIAIRVADQPRVRTTDTPLELRFRDPRRFGGVWCLAGSTEHIGRRLAEVGLEPLQATVAEFRAALRRARQIKALLMDQHVVAGLGNIYCDEALHAAHIHPLSKSDRLDGATIDRLYRAVRSVLNKAIRFNGTTLMDYRTAGGAPGSFQRHHRVYQREDEPCKTCGEPIVRIQAAGRSTFFCKKCQVMTPHRRGVAAAVPKPAARKSEKATGRRATHQTLAAQ